MSTPRDPVARLIAEHVDSYETLELLLRLARTHGEPLSSAGLARELQVGDEIVAGILSRMERAGYVRRTGAGEYEYDGTNPASAPVELLARRYEAEPSAVLQIVSMRAVERVRGSAARLFAALLAARGE